MQNRISVIGRALRESFINLRRNDPLILASSTAFFTTFSLSPILVILVNLLSLIFGNNKVSVKLFETIKDTFGKESAEQIEGIVNNVLTYNSNTLITIIGFIFLIFVATTLLQIVKEAINKLWHIKRKVSRHIKYNFTERAVSFVLILLTGVLFLASLLLDASLAVMQEYLQELIPSLDVTLIRLINIVFSILVVTAWFTIIFKFLPNAKIQWGVATTGGLLTAVLFNIGKWILGKLLLYNNVVTFFGASASFALILLFIFYSALILYYGASFTFVYGDAIHKPILPGKYSVRFKMVSDDEEQAKE